MLIISRRDHPGLSVWDLNPMTTVFIRGIRRHQEKRRLHEDGDRMELSNYKPQLNISERKTKTEESED